MEASCEGGQGPEGAVAPQMEWNYLTFMCRSTCFGRLHAHHQELNNCSSSLWFYLRSVVIAALLVVVWPDHDEQRCYHQRSDFNTLNAELNAVCYLLALLGAHPILHVSRIRVKTRGC